MDQIDSWFDMTVVPKRTTFSGFSPNRISKSPRGIFFGNQSDANGLCGDASEFVIDAFDAAFLTPFTPDGYQIGMVLWKGYIANHIANVMLPSRKAFMQEFRYVAGTLTGPTSAPTTLTEAELLSLRVYDLYYKNRTTLGAWWAKMDGTGGTVTVGLQHEFS